MYNSMCKELKLILGGGPGSKNRAESREMKIEPSSVEDGVVEAGEEEEVVEQVVGSGVNRMICFADCFS